MRRLIVISLFLFSALNCFGQLLPIRSQYMFNAVPLNPALTGGEDALSISGSFRAQWLGFPGAPLTQSLSVHSPLKGETSAIGIQLFADQIGIDRNTGIYGSYAYRINMKTSRLSFGLAAGVNLVKSKSSELQTYDNQDLLLLNDGPTGVLPNLSFGVNYASKNYFVNFSLPFFLSHRFNGVNYEIEHAFNRYNFLLGAGASFKIGQKTILKPSFLFKYQIGNRSQFDINLMAAFNPMIEAGLSYRTQEALIALFKVNANNQLSFMYSFGLPLGKLLNNSAGSHEIGLKYNFLYKTPSQNPRYLGW